MDCQDSIQVVVRVRPQGADEISVGDFLVYSERQIRLGRNSFAFDRIFSIDSQQQDLFNHVGMKLVHHSLEGYNSCVFAYGQTGSGKTHTMVGSGDGIIQRSIEQLFLRINATTSSDYIVTCSYFEIYNEQLVDLLDQSSKKLTVREDMKRGVFVENLSQEPVANVLMAVSLLNQGIRNRHIGETQMNRESSRSHAVFSLNIQSKQVVNGCANLRSSKLHFVDLAGSERQKSTACIGDRLKEASNINKSLTTLGMVINSLSGQKRLHVPFRDSKLTFVLRDSLSGNSKTFIIATISSMPSSFQESLSTLKFAQRAKMVKLSAHINEESLSMNAEVLKAEIRRLKDELFRLKHELQEEKTRSSSPIQLQKSHFSELIINSYNRGVSEINEKINSLLELIPAVTSQNSLVDRLARQLSGEAQADNEKNVLVEYLSSNSTMLRNINDNLNAFVSLRQEIRAKASVEKLRLEELRTPHKVDREQIEQFSNAKNQELCEIKKTVLELRNELTEKDRCIEELARSLEGMKESLGRSSEENRYLKGYYEAKQSQLLLKLENHSVGGALTGYDYSEEIRTLLGENKHILEESTATISKLKSELHVKTHEIEMLSKNLLSVRKVNNQLTVDRDAIEGQLKLLQLDYDLLRADSLSLEERLETYTRGDSYTQKSVEQLLAERGTLESRHAEEMANLKEQMELTMAELSGRLEETSESNSQLTSDIQILTETVEFKNNLISKLEEQIRTKEEEACRLHKEFEEGLLRQQSSSRMELEEIEVNFAKEQQQRQTLQREVQAYRMLVLQKEKEITLLREEHSREITELRQVLCELEQLNVEKNRLECEKNSEIERYKLTLVAQEQEVEALKCAYVSEKDRLEQTLHDYKHNQATERAAYIEKYERLLTESTDEIAGLRQQIVLLQNNHNLNVSTINTLEAVIHEARNTLAAEMKNWKQSLEEMTRSNESLRQTAAHFSHENESLKNELTTTWVLAKGLKASNESLEMVVASSKRQLSEAATLASERTDEISKLKDELHETKEHLEKQKNCRETRLMTLQKKYNELKENHTKMSSEIQTRVEKEKQQARRDADEKIKQLEETRIRTEREMQKVVDWKKLMEVEFQAVHSENRIQIEQLSEECRELKNQIAKGTEQSKTEKFRHQQHSAQQDGLISALRSQLEQKKAQTESLKAISEKQVKEFNAEISALSSKITSLENTSFAERQKHQSEMARVLLEGKSKLEELQAQLLRTKQSCLTAQEGETLKSRLNEVLVSNYKLKNKSGQQEGPSKSSRLDAKISYYEEKFNLMKIEYSNSVETVRKLKQREMEIKELNCQLEEKLRAAQMELEVNSKQEIEGGLRKQNEELKAAIAQLKLQEPSRATRRESKEGKENMLELQNLKKDKETLSETLQLIRTKMLTLLLGIGELVTDEPQQEMLKKDITSNLRERDEAKQMIRTLSLFEEVLKKKEGNLSRNIRKEEKLKTQNSFIVKQNIYLKEKLKQIEEAEGSSAHKKVKRA